MMQPETSLVKSEQTAIALAPAIGMSREQLDLVKRTFAKGTSDDEFAIFIHTAQRMQLDIFAKQIYAVMRMDRRVGKPVMSIQVSIDGFRATAARTGELDGQDGPYWCGPDGVWKDVWLSNDFPAAAKVVVYRKGSARGFTGIATWASYVQMSGGHPVDMWDRFSDTMIAKCAEALALRKAFPSQLGGVYAPEEMMQASNDNRPADAIDAKDDAAEAEFHDEPEKPPANLKLAFEQAKTIVELEALCRWLDRLSASDLPLATADYDAAMTRLKTPRTLLGVEGALTLEARMRAAKTNDELDTTLVEIKKYEMAESMRLALRKVYGEQRALIYDAAKAAQEATAS